MSSAVSDHLLEVLDQLKFAGQDGLVTAGTELNAGARHYVWRDLRDRVGLDAAFFRDGVPLVGFSTADGIGLRALRKRLWNYGKVPLLLSTNGDELSAFDAAVLRADGTLMDPLATASLRRRETAEGLLSAFSRSEVEAGRYARDFASGRRNSTRVDDALLTNLSYLRRAVGTDQRRGEAVDVLVGGCLLASYLSDRQVLDERHLLELSGKDALQDVFRSGRRETSALFTGLAAHFNGDIFGRMSTALDQVDDMDLARIAGLLSGDDLPTGQGGLWPYDFSVLPPDLVSSVYEQLLEHTRHTDSAFYTPSFLVDIVLDEVLPWDTETMPTVIDLACGSGAFITEAFRRIAYLSQGRLGRRASYSELQTLLREHVFGIDKNASAAIVTVFGLYLALLEELDPPTAWESAVLPPLLGNNVIVGDAFSDNHLTARKYDVVVSNPPWSSKLTRDAAAFVSKFNVPVADKQIAAAFLWLAAAILAPAGSLGLVLPAKALLHNRGPRALAFRSAVFEKLNVRAVVDLSAVRRTVFETAIAPAAVLIADTRDPDRRGEDAGLAKELIHVAPHPRPSSQGSPVLVVAPEEVRSVRQTQAAARPDIWRTLLWGSPRDLDLLDRLRGDFDTVGRFAQKRGWISGQGFQVGGGDHNDSSDMIGMPMVETRALLAFQILEEGVSPFPHEAVHRPRDARLYRGPHTLIRRTTHQGRLVAAYVEGDLAFSNGLLGFSGDPADAPALAALAGATVSSLGQYWHFMTSASWGVEREFVEVNEHEAFPLASPSRAQHVSLLAIMARAARIGLDANLQRDLDDIVFDMYKLSDAERERVRRSMVEALGRYRSPSNYATSPDDATLGYVSGITQALSGALDAEVTSSAWRKGAYQVVSISLGPASGRHDRRRGAVDVDAIVAGQRQSDASTGLRSLPAGFFVDEDTFYIVKTLDRDRWSIDASLDDADRILSALLGAAHA